MDCEHPFWIAEFDPMAIDEWGIKHVMKTATYHLTCWACGQMKMGLT